MAQQTGSLQSSLTKLNRATAGVVSSSRQQRLLNQTTVRAASNGTLATATSLGSFPASKRIVKNSVGQGNPVDFYRFDVTTTSRIKLSFFNRSEARLNAAILDASGNLVSGGSKQRTAAAAGQKVDTLIRGAAANTYYVRVKGAASGSSRYEINLFVNSSAGPQPLPCGCGG